MKRSLLLCVSTVVLLSAPAVFAFDSMQLKAVIESPEGSPKFSPAGLALEPGGRLWVSDSGTHQVLLFSATGQLLLRVGRQGTAPGEFQNPRGLALDDQGHLLVADAGNHRIQRFSASGEFLSMFGEKGVGPGQLKNPQSVAVSADGVVFVSEMGHSRIQLFSRDGVFYRALDAGQPVGAIAVDAAGRLYTLCLKTRDIQQWTSAGQMRRSVTGVEPGLKALDKPSSLFVDTAGALWVGDNGPRQVRQFDEAGRTTGTFGRSGRDRGQFQALDAVVARPDLLAVADSRSRRVTLLSIQQKVEPAVLTPSPALRLQVSRGASIPSGVDRVAWNPDGRLHGVTLATSLLVTFDPVSRASTTLDLARQIGIRKPSGLATAPASGSLFIADAAADRIVKLDKQGTVLLEYPRVFNPQGLTCSPQGVLYVVSGGDARFQAFNHQGLFQFEGGVKGTGSGQLRYPVSIAWDADTVHVADLDNKKIATFNASGRFLREFGAWGPEPLEAPRHVTTDREGNVFVLDAQRSRIQVYDAQGVYLGGFGYAGQASGAFEAPRHFALNDRGDLAVADARQIHLFHVSLLPPAPMNLTATPGEGYVTLRWDPVPARVPGRYIVYRRSPDGENVRVKDTVETTLVDDTLSPGTPYVYTVVSQSVQDAVSVPSAGVTATARAVTSGPRLEIVSASIEDVFSAHYKLYSRTPLGRVVIKNNSLPPVRKIKVSFAIQGYMDYPTEVELAELGSMESRDVPLLATFNNRILEVAETTPIQAQVKLTYWSGDQEAQVVRNLPFKLYSRNSIRWSDKDSFASFVTPNDPPVVDVARAMALPLMDARRGSPLPAPVSTAWSVFSGLGVYGISYLPRPNNPYDRISLDSSTVDTLQFARETLARKSGDCGDVVALLASMLESLTVTTVALDAPGHLFLMFDTGETQREALGFPESMLVSYAGTWWIPVEATMIGQPFMAAWKQGADLARQWAPAGQLNRIDIHRAWRQYEPVTQPDIASGSRAPAPEAVEEKFRQDWKMLVDLRWETVQGSIQKQAEKNPASGEPALRMGHLAVEFRRFDEAKEHFLKAKQDPATAAAALNNLGNLAMLRQDLAAAEAHYTQAHQKDPQDPMILINLARLHLKAGAPQKASAAYDQAMALDPRLREQYPDVAVLTP